MALSLVLAHCSKAPTAFDPKYGVSSSPRVVQTGEAVPKGGGVYRVGKPYTIAGQTYVPEENTQYSAEGTASWYGEDFHGRRTANREVYDMNAISAAHPTLPIPSYARVTNLRNKRSIIVRVNDRGPYHQGRLIDVSVRTAKLLGFHENGIARVRVEYVGAASLGGSDDTKLAATLSNGAPAQVPAVQVASSNPLLPPFFGARASARQGPVPTPPNRPFELGYEAPASRVATSRPQPQSGTLGVLRVPAAPAPTPAAAPPKPAVPSHAPARTVAAAPSAQSSFDSRFAPAANLPAAPSRIEPTTAFAPAPARQNPAFTSGRGLY